MKKVWFEDKETSLEPKLWFPFWDCKDRRELYFPRLFRQEESMKKVRFEDKQTSILEPKLWFPFWGL
jgi:hypothetical protein